MERSYRGFKGEQKSKQIKIIVYRPTARTPAIYWGFKIKENRTVITRNYIRS